MADIGRLRQAGGAGRVDRQRAVGDRHAAALRCCQRRGGKPLDLAIDARNNRRRRATRFSAGWRVAPSGTARCNSPATITCFGATMSMQCASAGPRNCVLISDTTPPTAGDAEPDRDIFRPVRHHQADGFALGELLVERPARIAAAALDQRAIGQRARAPRSAPRRRLGLAPCPRWRRAGGAAVGRRSARSPRARAPSRAACCPCCGRRVVAGRSRRESCFSIAQQSESFASTMDKI